MLSVQYAGVHGKVHEAQWSIISRTVPSGPHLVAIFALALPPWGTGHLGHWPLLKHIETNPLKRKINALSEALQDFPIHSHNLQTFGKFATQLRHQLQNLCFRLPGSNLFLCSWHWTRRGLEVAWATNLHLGTNICTLCIALSALKGWKELAALCFYTIYIYIQNPWRAKGESRIWESKDVQYKKDI